MRILISGGSGFIGRKLARALADRGDVPVVLTRGEAPVRDGVVFVTYDPSRSSGWVEELKRADAVVNLAGASVAEKRWTKERLALIRSSRVETTSRLVEALASASSRPKILVSASAVGIYGLRADDAVLDESSARGDDALAEVVGAWEAAALQATPYGVRVALPRIGIVLGGDGGVVEKMLPAFKAFAGGPLGPGTQYLSWIHWRDAVKGILLALDTPGFDGPYNLTAPRPVTMDEFAKTFGKVLGRPAALRVPTFALKLAVGDGVARLVSTGQRAVPKRLQAAGLAFEFPEVEAALADVLRQS